MIPWRNIRRFFQKALKQPGYALRVFRKRFRAYLSYLHGDGKSASAESITLFLTHRCNLHCQMCGQWGDRGITKSQGSLYIDKELALGELKSFIDDIAGFQPNITLFGGEPLLYPQCLEVIRYIKQKKMHCVMITNGTKLAECAEEIIGSGLDELNISLDGKGALHDAIRGMPGLFEKIMQGLNLIQHFKLKKRKRKPLINLQCTINKHNYLNLDEMLEAAKEAYADSLTFHHLIFLQKQLIERQREYEQLLHCSAFDWEGFIFEPDIDPEALYEKMEKVLSIKVGFGVDFYPNFSYKGLLEYYRNPRYMPSEYACRCLSPWMAAYIFPDGQVRPCLNFSYSFGNIKDQRFSGIWNSSLAIQYRQLLRQKGAFPVCMRCTELYRY